AQDVALLRRLFEVREQVAILERAPLRALEQRFRAPGVVGERARPAQEFDPHVAAHLLPADDLDRADLAGVTRVRAAARGQIPLGNLDDADLAGDFRGLAQCEL